MRGSIGSGNGAWVRDGVYRPYDIIAPNVEAANNLCGNVQECRRENRKNLQ